MPARPPKAGIVTSLGFGHVSALVAIVHPAAFAAGGTACCCLARRRTG